MSSGIPKLSPYGEASWRLVQPDAGMGCAVAKLVERCPPLDRNSVYCNLLQCHHFAATSVAAGGTGGDLVCFVSAYLPPERPATLFIWQVAVDPRARQPGLAHNVLRELLGRARCLGVTVVETTVTGSNALP